jgi:hypothetical protein
MTEPEKVEVDGDESVPIGIRVSKKDLQAFDNSAGGSRSEKIRQLIEKYNSEV